MAWPFTRPGEICRSATGLGDQVPHQFLGSTLLFFSSTTYTLYSYSVWHKSIPCWGSMNKTRPKSQRGVMWCDPTLSYHDTWTLMTGLFQTLQHKKAFRCILLIPDSAPHAVSIMEAWSDSMPSTHTGLCTVPAINHPCCVGTSVFLSQPTNVHIHLVHKALAETQHPVYTHSIVSTLREKIKSISGASLNRILCAPFLLRVATESGTCGGTRGLRTPRHGRKYSTPNQ